MKLNNYLYKVLDVEETPEGVAYSISLIRESPIYQAHFPNMPITPGVCMIQMAEELLADHIKKRLQTVAVKNAKFLSILDPNAENIKIHLTKIKQEGDMIKVYATIMDCYGTMFAKLSLICNVV
jgi:3-hydroxyacyl-[acyl-carrier-protein] dehydratase